VTIPHSPSSIATARIVKSFSSASRPRIQAGVAPARGFAGGLAASPPHYPSAAAVATHFTALATFTENIAATSRHERPAKTAAATRSLRSFE